MQCSALNQFIDVEYITDDDLSVLVNTLQSCQVLREPSGPLSGSLDRCDR